MASVVQLILQLKLHLLREFEAGTSFFTRGEDAKKFALELGCASVQAPMTQHQFLWIHQSFLRGWCVVSVVFSSRGDISISRYSQRPYSNNELPKRNIPRKDINEC